MKSPSLLRYWKKKDHGHSEQSPSFPSTFPSVQSNSRAREVEKPLVSPSPQPHHHSPSTQKSLERDGLPDRDEDESDNDSTTAAEDLFLKSLDPVPTARPIRQTAHAAIALYVPSGSHGYPSNAVHGPPQNSIHGPPNFDLMIRRPSFDTLSTSSSQKFMPHRPPRPPSLYTTPPYTPPIVSPPVVNATTDNPPSSSTRVRFATSPKPSSSYSRLAIPAPPPPQSIRLKRSMPELDGVWKGFLEDVNTDSHSYVDDQELDSAVLRSQFTVSASGTRSTGTTTLRRKLTASVPDFAHAMHSPHHSRTVPNLRNRHHDSGSSPYLPCRNDDTPANFEPSNELAVTSPPSPSSPSPTRIQAERTRPPSDFSLDLFPHPPPLSIRRKVPKHLVLQPTPSIAALPASPDTSSSESTPVATPTTPSSPQSTRKDTIRPISILKTSSRYPGPTQENRALRARAPSVPVPSLPPPDTYVRAPSTSSPLPYSRHAIYLPSTGHKLSTMSEK